MNWISVKDRLPQNHEYVLIYIPNNGHYPEDKPDGEKLYMAYFTQGKVPNEGDDIYVEDQYGNNLVPYCWRENGPMTWFGQDPTHWCNITTPLENDHIVEAYFTSVWDGGILVTTLCRYNVEQNVLVDVDPVDISGVENLTRQYVTLRNGDIIDIEGDRDDSVG